MPASSRILHIPVKFADDHWELLYGGRLKVRNHSLAELRIDKASITDATLLKALTAKHRVRILEQGAKLQVALTVDNREKLNPVLSKELVPPNTCEYSHTAKISSHSRFVRITLGKPTDKQIERGEKSGGLWLDLEGMEPRGVESSTIDLPLGLGLDPAISINHAFTLLSERFEPWRKAHTGNIYERVFYQDSNGTWYPLKDLRERELATAERAVISVLWDRISSELGLGLF